MMLSKAHGKYIRVRPKNHTHIPRRKQRFQGTTHIHKTVISASQKATQKMTRQTKPTDRAVKGQIDITKNERNDIGERGTTNSSLKHKYKENDTAKNAS